MDDEVTTLSQSASRTRARRFDAPRFSRSIPQTDTSPWSLIENNLEPESADEGSDSQERPPEPTPAEEKSGPDLLREVLRELTWSESDIARILVGPAQSHLTAEGLFRQHAANPTEDQARLVDAFRRAGAPKVSRDPSLLEGLDPGHLQPEEPADLTQIVAQFAQLPDVQKRRFLALLDGQKLPPRGKAPAAETPADPARPPKVGATPQPKKEPAIKEPASKGDEVLSTVFKGSFDTLETLIKGLLGSERAGKNAPASPKGSTKRAPESSPAKEDPETPEDKQAEESESEETADPSSAEDSETAAPSDSYEEDENTTPYGPPSPDDLLGDLGSESEPD